MAARKDSRLKTQHREGIRTSMLIKRLQKHTVKECMTPSQIRAAEILLNKTLPNLKQSDDSLTVGGEVDQNIKVTVPDFDGNSSK